MLIQCGNGGDWEFCRDTIYWDRWIAKYMPGVKYRKEIPQEADKLILKFHHSHDEVIFKLKAPEYITYEIMRELDNDC